ncbi:adenomatous polyposis coli protein [Scaptodrosophila lebanonensis]|uniref:Adenomatous polyposis coli protein n=1 Tax=Drosophila lebanonensis TaxID=7225 RepID=A0A6J2T1V7_DROLE|nr:adenomatous polyposis coli protein [Scaptodrosophila lebanonensis]
MTSNESDAQKQLELVRNFLELSRSADTCTALRSSDCIQLLVQILHSNDAITTARRCAGQALQNIVHSNPEEKDRQREIKVLRLLDQILDYSNFLRTQLQSGGEAIADDEDRHPLAAIKMLMKASFDEEHRQTMCELGALKAIPNLVHLDHAVHGPAPGREQCNSLRSYALMALTNLTFGDENVHNKAYLCGQKQFMEVVIAQLDTAPDELLQVVAGVLRNLSWRADKNMKTIFNEIGTVTALAQAAMKNKNENTLKAILSALWNLSAHCSTNKAEFCAVDGALAFLVRMLSYEGPSKTLKIIENAGGILRNVSSHIAVCEPYRQILRDHNCLSILLQQLKCENMTVVSNSCGTLWNLSARCPQDQKFLLEHNAIPLLRALVTSKNAMIAEGSGSALKNLINFRAVLELAPKQQQQQLENINGHADTLPRRYSSMRLSNNPTGSLKKVRASPPVSGTATLPRKCESRESIYSDSKHSSKSDSVYEQRKLTSAKSHFEMAPTEEQPIDYSMKYSEHETKPTTAGGKNGFDIEMDQPTDFSVRYNERPPPSQAVLTQPSSECNSEILLILDENASTSTVSCEAQPLAKSASACELNSTAPQRPNTLRLRTNAIENLATPAPPQRKDNAKSNGSHTPELGERPTNYCEEGTPSSFSRYDSLTSLTEKGITKFEDRKLSGNIGKPMNQASMDAALETPLMFSRRSSMDSLVDDETITCEDAGSVISDYSRLQSGVISPSELPDSPTQCMPQSPRRVNNKNVHRAQPTQAPQQRSQEPPLKSNVFEDKVNSFHVEHTPAVFSTATSLSNLSVLDDSNVNVNDDVNGNQQNSKEDEPRSYCTEDTPAILSKACSNSNLSMLSMPTDTNGNEQQRQQSLKQHDQEQQHPSLPTTVSHTEDAISKMRCGGRALPSYLPVRDEMNKYFVEDSPCNFSIISGLSNLTVGSAQVGPISALKESTGAEMPPKLPPRRATLNVEPRLPPKRSDSLSSLSMDSDDDSNLLSQAIAAGSTRPKAIQTASHTNTLPKPTGSSHTDGAASNGQRRQTMLSANVGSKTDYSSDDSLDDGQSKSLLEQCILSGMHKSNDALEVEPKPIAKAEQLLTKCPNADVTDKSANNERFVSNQVRHIESMLAGRPPAASSSQTAMPAQQQQQSRHQHWV